MTDLRTRIAAAMKADIQEQAYTLILLEKEEPYSVLIDGTVNLLEVADAVIAELGLRLEALDEEMVTDLSVEPIRLPRESRYVTDWKTDTPEK